MSWVADRANWHRFDGWCAAHNVDPLALPCGRFFDLIQHFFVVSAQFDQDEQRKLNLELTGSIMGYQERRTDDRGIPIPDWWRESDEDSSASAVTQTLLTMKGWKG